MPPMTSGRVRQQQVVVALEVVRVVGEALAAIVGLDQAVALDHGAHGAVEDEDALREQVAQFAGAVGLHRRESVGSG